MCLNAGLDFIFCPIFTSAQLQEGYSFYMVEIFNRLAPATCGVFWRAEMWDIMGSGSGWRTNLRWEWKGEELELKEKKEGKFDFSIIKWKKKKNSNKSGIFLSGNFEIWKTVFLKNVILWLKHPSEFCCSVYKLFQTRDCLQIQSR